MIYYFTVNYEGKNESGRLLNIKSRQRAFELLLWLYGAEMQLVKLTEDKPDENTTPKDIQMSIQGQERDSN